MLMKIITHRWVQVFLLLLLLGDMVKLRHLDAEPVQRLRHMTFDYYNKRMPRKAFNDVVIVDINADSLKEVGQWPWPRTKLAELPVILREMGAKVVAFDMVFAEQDRTSPRAVLNNLSHIPQVQEMTATFERLPDNDALFAQKMAEAGNVVIGFVASQQAAGALPVLKRKFDHFGIKGGQDRSQEDTVLRFIDKRKGVSVSLPDLAMAAAGNGSFGTSSEDDGVIRRVPLLVTYEDAEGKATKIYPALALETLRVAMGETKKYAVTSYGKNTQRGYGITKVSINDYDVPTDANGRIWVYYAGHRKNIYIPAWQVLAREVSPEKIKDKIVLIGTSAIGLLDIRSSPINPFLPGVEIHAEIIEQILHSQYLKRPQYFDGVEQIALVVIGLFVIFLTPYIGTPLLALLVSVLVTGAAVGSLYVYQRFGYLLDPSYPSLAIVTIFMASAVLNGLRMDAEKRAVRKAFSLYISPVLLEKLARSPEKLKLGGEVRELSVIFTDIRNFTTISESMDPAELIHMMNQFLTPMTSAVLNNQGTVDKYMGDAMMAFWNAPLDDPDHTKNACKTALEMVRSLGPVNEELKKRAEQQGRMFHELKAGIGIHSGAASVGNMGSRQRFAYSAIGDTVNLASRIEGQTKTYGVSIMISEAVRQKAPDYAVIELDLLTVKGRVMPERVFALLGDPTESRDPGFLSFAATHAQMLESYRAQKWDEAMALGQQCTKLRPDLAGLYRLYEERIAFYRQNPPEPDWEGVWVAKDK